MSTTIAISPETRDQLKEFGDKGETYDDIVTRLLRSAKDRQIHDILMNTTNCLTIDEARARLKR
jgi:hypothetical protein